MTNHDTNGSSLASDGRPKLRAASTAVVSMLMAAALFGGVPTADAQAPPGSTPLARPCEIPSDPLASPVVPCGAILQLAPGSSADQRASVAQRAGARLRHNLGSVDAVAVLVPNERAFRSLLADPDVIEFIPDRINRLEAPPPGKGKNKDDGSNGSGQVMSSGAYRVGAHIAHSAGHTGDGIGVAIVDSGIDPAHADLTNVSPNCFSVTGTCDVQDAHGTHVAGIVGANDNGIDVLGVAPGVTLYSVRVFPGSTATDGDIMAGLQWILDNYLDDDDIQRIHVANMSFGRAGSPNDNIPFRNLITALDGKGIVLVASAGNNNGADVSTRIPAGYFEVAAIASSTAEDGTNRRCRATSETVPKDTASYFTNDGTDVALTAPGERAENVSRSCFISFDGILSTKLGGGTTRMAGTSMAAPHVSGAAALLLATGELPRDVISILQNYSVEGVPFANPFIAHDGIPDGILCVASALDPAENCPQ